ncbi:MAG: TetR/AcrR family transcriptional regulator [Kineosporiaceae bacterium]
MSEPARRRSGGARDRLHAAALELFSENGVSATSLQMIADRLGVTKAAVYHVYRTKDEIVLGLLRPLLQRLTQLTEDAEARPRREEQLDVLVTGLVDLVVENRQLAAVLAGDPFVKHLFHADPTTEVGSARIERLLMGPDPTPDDRVVAVMVGAALFEAGMAEPLSDLPGDVLARHLRANALRLLRVGSDESAASTSLM